MKSLQTIIGSLLNRKQEPEFKLTKRFFEASFVRTKTREKPTRRILSEIRCCLFVLPTFRRAMFSRKANPRRYLPDLFNKISCKTWRHFLQAEFGEQLKVGPWPDRKRGEAAWIFELFSGLWVGNFVESSCIARITFRMFQKVVNAILILFNYGWNAFSNSKCFDTSAPLPTDAKSWKFFLANN